MTTYPNATDVLHRIERETRERYENRVSATRAELVRAKETLERMIDALAVDPVMTLTSTGLETDDFFRVNEYLLAARASEAQARELLRVTRFTLSSAIEEIEAESPKYLVMKWSRQHSHRVSSSKKYVRIMRNGRPGSEFDPSRATAFETKDLAAAYARELRERDAESVYSVAVLEIAVEAYQQKNARVGEVTA